MSALVLRFAEPTQQDRRRDQLDCILKACFQTGSFVLRPVSENSVMILDTLDDLRFRPAISVVIEGQGFTGPVGRAGKGIGMSVIGLAGGREHSHPVEQGQYLFPDAFHLRVP